MTQDQIPLFEDLTLDLARGSLLRSGQPVHLRPQAYGVLLYLAERRGRLVGKDEILDAVWEGRAVTDGSLGKCVEEVREALGTAGRARLRNVRGRGYILESEAEADSSFAPALRPTRSVGPDAPRAPAGEARRSAWRSRPGPTVVLAAAVVLVVVVAALYLRSSIGRRSLTIGSLAVLPFANSDQDPQVEYVCDGLSEGLTNALAELPSLKVVASYSAFQYKGRESTLDPTEVGRALGVDALVLGRVSRHGDELSIGIELIDTRDRTQVWGERYTRLVSDLESTQRQMAHTISETLRVELTADDERQLQTAGSERPEAYAFYLNGLYHRRKGGTEDVKTALDYFHRTLALDPGFAPAWVAVAGCERYFAGNSLLDPRQPLIRAAAAVERALELDDTLAEAHVMQAGIELHAWRFAAAEREHRRALELNPNVAEAHAAYSDFLSSMGRPDEALAEIRLAQGLDPLRMGWKRREVWMLALARRFDEATALERSLPPLRESEPMSAGLVAAVMGKYSLAVDLYRDSIDTRGETTSKLCYLGHALARSGRRAEALAIVDRLTGGTAYVSPVELAVLYAGLGEVEEAMASLEKAYAEHDLQLHTLLSETHLDSLRSDPRFRDLIRRVGLPDVVAPGLPLVGAES